MRINIQCCRYLGVPHHLLNELEVFLDFKQPCTESMSKIVNRKMRENQWFTIFLLCEFFFFYIIVAANSFDCPI